MPGSEICERDQGDPQTVDGRTHLRIAEAADLLDAFLAVPLAQPLGVAGMTTQLDGAGRQPLEDPDEGGRADRLRGRPARSVVAVELPLEPDAGIEVADGDAELPAHRLEYGPEQVDAVPVVMRVEVRRIAPQQTTEAVELRTCVSCDDGLQLRL